MFLIKNLWLFFTIVWNCSSINDAIWLVVMAISTCCCLLQPVRNWKLNRKWNVGEQERERGRERESDSEETHRLMDTRRRMECRWTYWCYYRLHKSSFHKNIENVTLAFDRGQNVTQKTFFVTDQVSDFGFVFQMI